MSSPGSPVAQRGRKFSRFGPRGKSMSGPSQKEAEEAEAEAKKPEVSADEAINALFSQISQIRGEKIEKSGARNENESSTGPGSPKAVGGMMRRSRLIKKAAKIQQQTKDGNSPDYPSGAPVGGGGRGDASVRVVTPNYQQLQDEEAEEERTLEMAYTMEYAPGAHSGLSGPGSRPTTMPSMMAGNSSLDFVALSSSFIELSQDVRKINAEGVNPACMKYVDEAPLKDPGSVPSANYVKAQLRALKQSREYGLDYHKDFSRRCTQLKVEKSFRQHKSFKNIVNYVASNAKESPANPEAVLSAKEARMVQLKKRGAAEDQDLVQWYNSQIELRHSLVRESAEQNNDKNAKKAAILEASALLAQGQDINTALAGGQLGVGGGTGGADDVFSVITKKWAVHVQSALAVKQLLGAVKDARRQRENDVYQRQRKIGGYLSLTLQERARYWTQARRLLRDYVVRYKRRRYGVATNLLVRFFRHYFNVHRIVSALPAYRAKIIKVQRQVRFHLKVREARRTLLVMQWIKMECQVLKVPYHLLHRSLPDNSRVTALSLRRSGGGGTSTGVSLTSATLAYVKERRLKLSSTEHTPCITDIKWIPQGGASVDVRYRWACLEATKLLRMRVKEYLHFDRQRNFFEQEKVRFVKRSDEVLGVPPPRKPVHPIQYLLSNPEELRHHLRDAHTSVTQEAPKSSPALKPNAGSAITSTAHALMYRKMSATTQSGPVHQTRGAPAEVAMESSLTSPIRMEKTITYERRHSLSQSGADRLSMPTVSSSYRNNPDGPPESPSRRASMEKSRKRSVSGVRQKSVVAGNIAPPGQLLTGKKNSRTPQRKSTVSLTSGGGSDKDEDDDNPSSLTGAEKRVRAGKEGDRLASHVRTMFGGRSKLVVGTDEDYAKLLGKKSAAEMRVYLQNQDISVLQPYKIRKENELFKNGAVPRVKTSVKNLANAKEKLEEDKAMEVFATPMMKRALHEVKAQQDHEEHQRELKIKQIKELQDAGVMPLPDSPRRYAGSSPLNKEAASSARSARRVREKEQVGDHPKPTKPAIPKFAGTARKPRDLPKLGDHSPTTASPSPGSHPNRELPIPTSARGPQNAKHAGHGVTTEAFNFFERSKAKLVKKELVVLPQAEENLGVNLLQTLDDAFNLKRKQVKP